MKPREFQCFVARLGDDPHCPRCASRSIRPWGRSGDLRRHRCRVCGRTFTALSGTPLSGLHKRGVWLACAQALRDAIERPDDGAATKIADRANLIGGRNSEAHPAN